jgi:hypothetical protein
VPDGSRHHTKHSVIHCHSFQWPAMMYDWQKTRETQKYILLIICQHTTMGAFLVCQLYVNIWQKMVKGRHWTGAQLKNKCKETVRIIISSLDVLFSGYKFTIYVSVWIICFGSFCICRHHCKVFNFRLYSLGAPEIQLKSSSHLTGFTCPQSCCQYGFWKY